ncbi:MAG: hypothetical protein HND58_01465 [Planctomycetota bacterium]|nr:MAG: hypothetical protein HND58_01465 [Planctomycetota bacterium]
MTKPVPEERSRGFVRKHWRLLSLCLLVLLGLGATLVGVTWWVAARSGLVQGPKTAALGLGEDWSEEALSESQRRGDAVISAIKQYQSREGELPPSLEALVPDDIATIEPPVAGNRRWRYGPLGSHAGEYFLLVESAYCERPGYYGVEWFRYTSLGDKWKVFQDESF